MYEVERLDIGLTMRCNAGCPQCPRTDPNTSKAWDWLAMDEIYLDDFKKIVPPHICKNIKRFSFCGGYGDPLIARDVLEIIEYCRELSPNASIHIATNGSMKRPLEWWHKLGMLLRNNEGEVTFGIDGADQETHSTYRVHTNLETIFRNAEILRFYKVKLRWQLLLFDYNKDQEQRVREMAKERGFEDFIAITSTRRPVGELFYPVENSADLIVTSRYRKYNYFTGQDFNSLDCLSKKFNEVHITANGTVVPCCYVDSIYMISRYLEEHSRCLFGVAPEDVPDDVPEKQDVLNLYYGIDLGRFNAKVLGLEKVLEDPWWDSFFAMQEEFKVHKCNHICGVLK